MDPFGYNQAISESGWKRKKYFKTAMDPLKYNLSGDDLKKTENVLQYAAQQMLQRNVFQTRGIPHDGADPEQLGVVLDIVLKQGQRWVHFVAYARRHHPARQQSTSLDVLVVAVQQLQCRADG